MARHRLTDSTKLIDGPVGLGDALGYHSVPEHRVTETGAAVDVAWLREGVETPLFIFEVETRASGGATNNVSKVYGQDNQRLVKPLFFFHVFMSRSEGSERITALERLFGTQNYRVYRLGADQATLLVEDILAQHRRVSRTLDLVALVDALAHDALANVDLDHVLMSVEDLDFAACFVPAYPRLALGDVRLLPHLARQIAAEELYPNSDDVCWYSSYLGQVAATPLHLGILARLAYQDDALDRLCSWQGSAPARLGAAFRLSQEHDDFILAWAPPLWTLTAALFPGREARQQLRQAAAPDC